MSEERFGTSFGPMAGVPVDKPPPWANRKANWDFVLESLAGGLDDDGMLRWLSMQSSMAGALREAGLLRDGMAA